MYVCGCKLLRVYEIIVRNDRKINTFERTLGYYNTMCNRKAFLHRINCIASLDHMHTIDHYLDPYKFRMTLDIELVVMAEKEQSLLL